MPRNAQGLYTLPAGNPVVPNTLIESAWANSTMDDIASALTGSLPRDGSAPMTGPLTLQSAAPTQPRHAVSKGYLESFLAYATGMPLGSVLPMAGSAVPGGFLLCDGQAVSRTTYADLFAAIGTIYGSGDGSTTFNVPDLRDWFVRGKGDARPVGSTQAAAFASHAHGVSDPWHTHSAYQAVHDHSITTGSHGHSITTGSHSHGVTDPGHSHTTTFGSHGISSTSGAGVAVPGWGAAAPIASGAAGTGISIQTAGNLGGSTDTAGNLGGSADARQPAVTVNSSPTGISIGATGGDETRPQNIAMNYVIKAVNDASATVSLTGITSSDDNAISIDNTLATVPMLDIHSNVAFGLAKLDGSGKILLSQLPATDQTYLGLFDASGGQNPSQAYPATTFANGDFYIVSEAGTILVFDPATQLAAMTAVSIGWNLFYSLGSVTNPDGWYFLDNSSSAPYVLQTSPTGAARMPAGTTAQRDPSPQFGDQRANSDSTAMEWWNGTTWAPMGGGATGAPNNPFIYENDIHVTANYTVTSGKNAMSAGPIIVDDGVTVTIPDGSVWSIV